MAFKVNDSIDVFKKSEKFTNPFKCKCEALSCYVCLNIS